VGSTERESRLLTEPRQRQMGPELHPPMRSGSRPRLARARLLLAQRSTLATPQAGVLVAGKAGRSKRPQPQPHMVEMGQDGFS